MIEINNINTIPSKTIVCVDKLVYFWSLLFIIPILNTFILHKTTSIINISYSPYAQLINN